MADKVFLHVGTMKSGTTFLQSLWWRHRTALAERGLLLPGRRRDHFRSASIVCQRTEVLEELSPEELLVLDELLALTAAAPDDVLVSHELFSPASPAQAADALARFADTGRELHVLLTVRDLVRQLPSHWQEMVKQGSSLTLAEYAATVRDDRTDDFWTYQDVPAILDRWTAGVPAERVHVVVLPQTAPRAWLWETTAEVMGVDVTGLDLEARTTNSSLGIAEVEVIRRVHALLPAEEAGLALTRVAKNWFAPDMVQPDPPATEFANPPWVAGWAAGEGARTAETLRTRGYDVRGDPGDLVPAAPASPGGARQPEDVTADEVADAALAALARMLVHETHQQARIERLKAQRQRLRQRLGDPEGG